MSTPKRKKTDPSKPSDPATEPTVRAGDGTAMPADEWRNQLKRAVSGAPSAAPPMRDFDAAVAAAEAGPSTADPHGLIQADVPRRAGKQGRGASGNIRVKRRSSFLAFLLALAIVTLGVTSFFIHKRVDMLAREVAALPEARPLPSPPSRAEPAPQPKPEAEPDAPEGTGAPAQAAAIAELRSEIQRLRARRQLTQYADEAITNGSRFALRELERLYDDPLSPELKDAANSEIIRVETHYITTRLHRSIPLPVRQLFPDRKNEEELTIGELVEILLSETVPPEGRARAATLLGRGRLHASPEVADMLLRAARSDPNLQVVQACVVAFGRLTGFYSPKVFEPETAASWWADNREMAVARSAESPDERQTPAD